MPELPEVEVTRQSFAQKIADSRILALQLGKPLRWPLGVMPTDLLGRQVLAVTRRGKYLILHLNLGLLLLHLGMSGSVRFLAPSDFASAVADALDGGLSPSFSPFSPSPPLLSPLSEPPVWTSLASVPSSYAVFSASVLPPLGVHEHVALWTSAGCLRLHDPRRFGALVYAQSLEDPVAHKLLGSLGVEPLEGAFQVETFYQALRLRRSSIKRVLLAGAVVVGVGNIYAAESLFRAGILPSRSAQSLSRKEVQRLHAAIQEVLTLALQNGGSTLRNFSDGAGKVGYFQLQAMVYGRAGAPCLRCGTPIQKVVQDQRSSFFCPQCQR